MIRAIRLGTAAAAAFLFLALTFAPSGPARAGCFIVGDPDMGTPEAPADGEVVQCNNDDVQTTGVGSQGQSTGNTVRLLPGAIIDTTDNPGDGVRVGDDATIDTQSDATDGDSQIIAPEGFDGIQADGGGATIDHDGDIIAGDAGIELLGDDGDITNDGNITAGEKGIAVANDSTISNTGTITGGASDSPESPSGVSIRGSGNTLTNTGTIDGGSGPSVAFRGEFGDNTLILDTGSDLDGAVEETDMLDPDADRNVVRLRGAGNEDDDFDVPEGEIVMEGDSWTLSGDLDFEQTTVEAGVLTIEGDTLDTDELDVNHAAILKVEGGGTVNVSGDATTNLRGTLEVEDDANFSSESLVVPEDANAVIRGLGEAVTQVSLVRGSLALPGRLVVIDDLVVTPGGAIFVPPGADHLQADEIQNGGLIDLGVGGVVDGDLDVGSGGRLTGGGDIVESLVNGDVTVGGDILDNGNESGTVAPGNSIGTIIVNGDYTQGPTGFLEIEIDERGESDLLVVSGDMSFEGTLLIDSDADASGIGDFFDAAVFWDGDLLSDPDAFDVVSVGRAFATATVVEDNSGSIIVGAISPSQLDSRIDSALDNGFLFTNNLSGRLHGVRDDAARGDAGLGTQLPLLASNGAPGMGLAAQLAMLSGPTAPDRTGGPGAWIRGVGWFGERDAEKGVLGYDYRLAGVIAGGDYALADTGWIFGGAFSYSHTWADVDGTSTSTDADNYLFGAYAGYDWKNYFADLAVGGGFSNYDSSRNMTVLGETFTAKGDFDGGSVAVRATGGADYAVGEGFMLRPLVAIDYVWVGQDGYSESGAMAGDLVFDDLNAHALKLHGILVATRQFSFGSEMRLVPELRGGVVGQFALDDREVGAALPGIGASGILPGNDSNEVRAAVGAGATLWMANGLAAFLDYGGEYGWDTRNTTLTGGVRFVF